MLAVAEVTALNDGVQAVSAPPFAASSLSSDSILPAARLCPVVSNVLPTHDGMQLGGATGAPPALNVYTGQLGDPSDIATCRGKMPRLREGTETCAQLFSGIGTRYNPNWTDPPILFK